MRYAIASVAMIFGVAILLSTGSSALAATVYLEDFTGQDGLGYTGPSTPSDPIYPAGVDWWIDVKDGYFTASSDWFRVDDIGGDEMFNAHDPGGPAIWYTPTIDISGYTDLELSIYVYTASNDIGEESNDWRIYYSVDGGSEVLVFDADDVWGPVTGENDGIPQQTVTASIPTGSELNVWVYTDTRSGVITLAWDDVMVTGVPEPATLGLLAMGGLVLARRRR